MRPHVPVGLPNLCGKPKVHLSPPPPGLCAQAGAQSLFLWGPVSPGVGEALALAGRVEVDRRDSAC